MSFTVSAHVRSSQVTRYIEDFHCTENKVYQDTVKDAYRSLWHQFNHNMDDPYNIALSEVMCLLSKRYKDGTKEEDIVIEIYDEVEDIFNEANAVWVGNDLSWDLYILCTTLFDYLVEEEGLDELNSEDLKMVVLKHNRVDATFY